MPNLATVNSRTFLANSLFFSFHTISHFASCLLSSSPSHAVRFRVGFARITEMIKSSRSFRCAHSTLYGSLSMCIALAIASASIACLSTVGPECAAKYHNIFRRCDARPHFLELKKVTMYLLDRHCAIFLLLALSLDSFAVLHTIMSVSVWRSPSCRCCCSTFSVPSQFSF